jgi:uncharacterized protein involved in exopolysaccharide biosynthesis
MKLLIELLNLSNSEMSQRLTDTNDAIETLKKQLKVENEQLKRELAEIKKNSGGNVSEFKKQLGGKRLMEFAIITLY